MQTVGLQCPEGFVPTGNIETDIQRLIPELKALTNNPQVGAAIQAIEYDSAQNFRFHQFDDEEWALLFDVEDDHLLVTPTILAGIQIGGSDDHDFIDEMDPDILFDLMGVLMGIGPGSNKQTRPRQKQPIHMLIEDLQTELRGEEILREEIELEYFLDLCLVDKDPDGKALILRFIPDISKSALKDIIQSYGLISQLAEAKTDSKSITILCKVLNKHVSREKMICDGVVGLVRELRDTKYWELLTPEVQAAVTE